VRKRESKTYSSQKSSDQKTRSNKNFLGIVTGKPCLSMTKKQSRFNVMVQADLSDGTLEDVTDRSFYPSKVEQIPAKKEIEIDIKQIMIESNDDESHKTGRLTSVYATT